MTNHERQFRYVTEERAASLTWVFSSSGNPHCLLLIGMGAILIFHLVETQRHRALDVWRSRVRLLEEDVFATALDPIASPKHTTWREELSQDRREPALKTPFFEAYVRRLRRVYSALLLILLAAWVARITVFTPGKGVLKSAAMIGITGSIVMIAVGIIYLIILDITFWPIDWKAKGEFYDREKDGEWKS